MLRGHGDDICKFDYLQNAFIMIMAFLKYGTDNWDRPWVAIGTRGLAEESRKITRKKRANMLNFKLMNFFLYFIWYSI